MGLDSGVKFGRAFVEVYATTRELTSALYAAEVDIRGFLRRVGLMSAGLGAAIIGGFLPAVSAAANRAETLNAFTEVFRGANAEAEKLIENMSVRLLRSQSGLAKGMTGIGAMVRGLGLGAEEAAEFAAATVQAGLDISSFYNEDEGATFARLRSALSGSSEAVDQFGINLRAQALELKLTELGYEGNIQKATELEKTLARLALIQDALVRQGAAGDLERTANSYANMGRSLRDVTSEALGNLGDALLPIATKIQSVFITIIKSIGDFAAAHPRVIQAIAGAGAAAVVTGVALVSLTSILGFLGSTTATVVLSLLTLVRVLTLIGVAAPLAAGALRVLATIGPYFVALFASLQGLPILGTLVRLAMLAGSAISWLAGVVASAGAVLTAEFWVPIALVVAAVAAIVWGIRKLNEVTGFATEMLRMFGEGWANLKSAMDEVWRLFSRFQEPLQALGNILRRLWSEEMARLRLALIDLGKQLKPIMDLIGGAFLAATETVLMSVVTLVETLERALVLLGVLQPQVKGLNLPAPAPFEEPNPVDQANPAAGDDPAQLAQFAAQVAQEVQTPIEVFAAQLARLNAALNAELITRDQYDKALAKAQASLRQATEDPKRQAILDAAQQVTDSQLTAAEKADAEVRRLTVMINAGLITQETYRRAVEEQRNKIAEIQQAEAENASQAADRAATEERNALKDRIETKADLRIKAARAAGDERGEIKATFQKYQDLAKAGFSKEAVNTYVQGLGLVVSGADAAIDAGRDARDNAAFVTTSRATAVAGLGVNAIDQQLLEKAQKAEADRAKAAAELERIRKRLEE